MLLYFDGRDPSLMESPFLDTLHCCTHFFCFPVVPRVFVFFYSKEIDDMAVVTIDWQFNSSTPCCTPIRSAQVQNTTIAEFDRSLQ